MLLLVPANEVEVPCLPLQLHRTELRPDPGRGEGAPGAAAAGDQQYPIQQRYTHVMPFICLLPANPHICSRQHALSEPGHTLRFGLLLTTLQLRLTSGPKKSALELLRRKIEAQNESVLAARQESVAAAKVHAAALWNCHLEPDSRRCHGHTGPCMCCSGVALLDSTGA